LMAIIQKNNLNPQQFIAWQTWVVILVMSVLVGIILVGIFLIFVYQRKTLALYRSQHKFINSFTHELKTPTASLQLYLETFAKYDLPRNKQLKYLNYMLEDVARLSENISGILNLARIEAKIYGGEFTVVHLAKEVEEFCNKNKHLFRGSNILIDKTKEQSYYCSINHSLFQMLMMNLLSNGIRHNKNKKPEIRINFSHTEKNIQIHFTDNGVGFKKSQIKKIFKKFFQIEEADWGNAGGTGLGLYMVEQVVRLHKGRIKAQSGGIGKGAQFTVSLPRKYPPEKKQKSMSQKKEDNGTSSQKPNLSY